MWPSNTAVALTLYAVSAPAAGGTIQCFVYKTTYTFQGATIRLCTHTRSLREHDVLVFVVDGLRSVKPQFFKIANLDAS